MKAKILSLILVSTTFSSAYALGPQFGVKLGLPMNTSSAALGSTSISDGYKFGFLAGPSLNIGLGPASIMVDVLYAKRIYGFSALGVSDTASMTRLEVPVIGNFSLGLIGIEAGFNYATGLGSINYGSGASKSFAEAGYSKSDFEGIIGLSVSPPLPVINLIVELRYNLGLKELSTTTASSFKTRSFDLTVGCYF